MGQALIASGGLQMDNTMQTTHDRYAAELERLLRYWDGRPYVTLQEVASLLFTWGPKTIRNNGSSFPVRTTQFVKGGKRMCLVEDVARYVIDMEQRNAEGLCSGQVLPSDDAMPKRGRPTRAEESAARAAGFGSVLAWRQAQVGRASA